MNDIITAATSGLFVEVGKVIEHMKVQQARIADLERQLAEASAPAVEQQPEWEDFDIEKTGDDHFDAGNFLLNAAKQFWSACHKAKQYGAVQWLLGENGELLIFTRGEYKSTLLHNIEMYGPTKHFKEPQAADTDKVREAIFMAAIPVMAINGMNTFSSWEHECWARGALAMRTEVLGILSDIEAQAPVREVPGWASVKDSLPTEQRKEYLVWCSSNKCWYTAMLDYENKWRYFAGQEGLIEEEVTHWMPLPSPPEADK